MGSSPLTRGKHQGRRERRHRVGLIPAHAGKTLPALSMLLRARAHPRSRGENPFSLFVGCATTGSSPLTRGKPPSSRPRSTERRAHPRSRGENSLLAFPNVNPLGSSPLTRGKHLTAPQTNHRSRLIPAHAGKTFGRAGGASPTRAHPRSRGENLVDRVTYKCETGSSPLTRGKHLFVFRIT